MQKVIHDAQYVSPHWLLDDIERLYTQFSEPEGKMPMSLTSHPFYDESFKDLCKVFYDYSNLPNIPTEFRNYDVTPLTLPKYDPKKIIVCFSGGKDSLSTLIHYKELGYEVYAYHILGLNKTYGDEWTVAKVAAEQLGVTFVLDQVKYTGQHIWVEHPMKNMIMMNMALSYGIRNNLTTQIATGNFDSSFLVDSAFGVSGGDCKDMWSAYEKIVQRVIPGFQVLTPLVNYQDSYETLLKRTDLLPHTLSCMTPVRFRKLFRERTEKNYNIHLMPNRCGCCWKDAAEYIWFVDHDVLELNKEYYFHCLEVLSYTTSKELGFIRNVPRLWSMYFFYPMSESKVYEELKNAFISAKGKIKFTNNSSQG